MLEESVSKPGFVRSFTVLILIGLLWIGGSSVAAQAQGGGAATTQDTAATEVNNAPAATPANPGGIPDSQEAIAAGTALFKNNCQQCHAVQEVVVGPALKNVHQRRDVDWLKAFIRNSQKVIQSGDPYAVNLYNQYNKIQMPAFNFKDDEILSMLAYIKAESDVQPGSDVGQNGGTSVDGGETGTGGEAGATPAYITVILVVLGVVLVLVLIVLALVLAVLRRYLNQRSDLDATDREIIDRSISVKGIVTSKPFLFLLVFLFTAVAFKSVIDGLYNVGVQQGYMPTQPIAYSHKLHAGTYQIDCNYCHTGAYKAKSANIPSVNICMNCHNSIKTDSPEIQKLYAAIKNNQPIEWVRVHNLPDLVYFNHAQHTSVGGVECQTCHGPIQEMEVVYQYSKLTMGWCINCHRETEVKTEGNEYYDKLVKLHEVSNAQGNMTVEDIGGIECSRCHF